MHLQQLDLSFPVGIPEACWQTSPSPPAGSWASHSSWSSHGACGYINEGITSDSNIQESNQQQSIPMCFWGVFLHWLQISQWNKSISQSSCPNIEN